MKPSLSAIVGVSILVAAMGSLSAGQEKQGPVPQGSLALAALGGNVEQVKAHIAAGTDVNAGDAAGVPPLVYAAQQPNVEVVRLLLDAGARVNTAGPDGKTPLIMAAQRGSRDIVALLLSKGADAKAKDQMQTTALHWAVQWGEKDMVGALIEAGADVNARDGAQQTPLMLAEANQKLEIAELLKQRGATPTGPDMALPNEAAQGGQEAGAAAVVVVDVNAIRLELKEFDGLEAALQKMDANSTSEQRAWVQQRTENRTTLLRLAEKQLGDEMAFVRKIAGDEKATKTIQGIDDMTVRRKARVASINTAIREERRMAMQQGMEPTGMGAGVGMQAERGRMAGRATRGRMPTAMPGQTGVGPEAAPNGRRAEPNEPAVDPAVSAVVQAWGSATPQSKQTLLDAVHKLDLADLAALRTVAVEEKAKKTAAAISGVMLIRQLRMEKVTKDSADETARLQKLQDRMGMNNTMMPGRGMRGATTDPAGQTGQTTTGRTNRRYR